MSTSLSTQTLNTQPSTDVTLYDLRPDLRPAHPQDPITVLGDLDLYDTHITSLPAGLTVSGDLDLFDTPITQLPEGLNIGGYLDLRRTQVVCLPHTLQVGGRILPSEDMGDLLRLRSTLTEPLVLSNIYTSAHTRAQIHRTLLAYPDVLRVFQSLRPKEKWTIHRLET